MRQGRREPLLYVVQAGIIGKDIHRPRWPIWIRVLFVIGAVVSLWSALIVGMRMLL